MSDVQDPDLTPDPVQDPDFEPDADPDFQPDEQPQDMALVPVRYDEQAEAYEQNADAELRALFDAGLTKAPDRWAGVLELANKSGAPVDIVEDHYDDFKRSAELAGFDPRAWRRDNPGLHSLIVRNPRLGPVVFREKAVREFSAALLKEPDDMPLWAKALAAGGAAMTNPSGASGGDTLGVMVDRPAQAPEIEARQPTDLAGPIEIAKDVFSRRRKQSEIASLGTKQLYIDAVLLDAETSGDHDFAAITRRASHENSKNILRIQQDLGLPPDYPVDGLGQLGIDVVEGVGSQWDSIKAYGAGAAVGGVVAGAGAAAISRGNPTAIRAAARGGAFAVAQAAGFLSSFNQETGSSYLEFRSTLDDNKKPMDPAAAMGAAAVYGLLAGSVELMTVGPMLKAFGVPATATGAEAKVALKAALSDRSKRAMLSQFGRDWAKSTAAEGAEEGVQSLLQSTANWAGRSVSAGTAQSFDMEREAHEAMVSVWKGAAGSLGLGGIQMATNVTSEFVRMESSRRAASRVAAIAGIAKSSASRAAPKEIAKLVEEDTARTGEKVTSLYVDPVRLTQAIATLGGDAEQVTRELMGETGPERMRQALAETQEAPGSRATLEVPVAEFLERWGDKPIVESLIPDITTRQGKYTRRDEILFQSDVDRLAKKLVAESSKDATPDDESELAAGPHERSFARTVERQLVDTQRMSRDEARKSLATTRAFIRTMAKRMGKSAEDQFQYWTLTVQSDIDEAIGPPRASRLLTDKLRVMSPEQRAELMWLDSNTGLYSARGFSALPVDASRPFVAHYSIEGTKWKNKQSHTAGNELYRLAGQALSSVAQDATKWGGDFVSSVSTPEEAREIAAKVQGIIRDRMRELNPEMADQIEGLQVTAEAVARGENLAASVAQASALNAKEKERREKTGERSERGRRPRGLPMESASELNLATGRAAMRAVPETLLAHAGELSDEAIFNTVFVEESTGLLTREGWLALPRKKHVVSIDLNGLNKINETHGEEVGNAILRAFSRAARTAGAAGVDMAHLSGDEYAAQANDAETAQLFVDILAELAQVIILRLEDGSRTDGVSFGYGIANDYDAADALVEPHKLRERSSPGAEEAARRGRDRDRRDRGLSRGGESIARGDRAQGYAGVRKRTRQDRREARAIADERRRVERLRLDVLASGDSQEVAEKLRQSASPEAAALAATTTARLVRTSPPKFSSYADAFNKVLQASAAESITPIADSRYAEALAGKGPMPGPYGDDTDDGTFDETNGLLDLSGKKKAKGLAHAFDLLMGHFDGSRAEKAEKAIAVLNKERDLQGRLRMPDEYVAAKVEEHAARAESAAEAAAYDEEEQGDTSFDPDTFYQPAYHGTPHRDIEKFSLDKIGTGEGAQAFGWGLYFTEKKEIAEHYRKTLASKNITIDGVEGYIWYDYRVVGNPQERVDAMVANRLMVNASAAGLDETIDATRAWLTAWVRSAIGESNRVYRQAALDRLDSFVVEHRIEIPVGQVHKVEIPDSERLLDYDKPLGEQPQGVRDILLSDSVLSAYASEDRTGWQIYDLLSSEVGPRRASETFNEAGIPGLRYLDGDSRSKGEGHHNFVIWSEEAIEELDTLYQPGGGRGDRGWVELAQQGMRRAFRVFLTENSDLSTFLHESAHVYFEMLGDLAGHTDAGERVKSDYGAVLKWLGAESRADVTREQKEKFARGFEAYLRDGKAPSPKLAEAFTAFRLWLTEVYKSLATLDVELNDDIRGVFDRMLATDSEIKRMRQAAGLDEPLWRSHVDAGMEPAEWAKYLQARADITTRATLTAQRQIADAQLRATKAYKSAEFKRLMGQAGEEWAARKDFQAWRFILRGDRQVEGGRIDHDSDRGKLDRDQLRRIVGDDSALEKKLRGRLAKKNGEHPTAVAQIFGYENGREMLEAVSALPDGDEWIRTRAEQMMREKHPEIDGELARLEQLVQESMHNDGTGEVLVREMASLSRKSLKTSGGARMGAAKLPPDWAAAEFQWEAARQAARDIISKRKVGRLDPGATLNRERSAAERAAIEAAKDNFAQALVQKKLQALEHHKWRELTRAAEDREKFVALVKKMAETKRREVLARAGKNFLDASDQILEALQIKPAGHDDERINLERALITIENEDAGASFEVDEVARVVANAPDNGWRDLTVDEMRLVHRALSQLYTLARDRNTVIVEGRRVEIAELVAEIDREASARPDQGPPPEKPRWSAERRAARLEPQEAIRRLGPTAYRALWTDGYIRAERAEDELAGRVGRFFAEEWDKLPQAMRDRRYELLEDLDGVPWPDDVDRQPTRDRQWMWMVALNIGNKSNRERLMGGYKWSEQSVLDWLNRNMAKEEWGFVESVWKLLDQELYPEVSRAYEEATGLPPPKIEATPIETPFGMVSGGYFPARYDPVASRVGENQARENLEKLYHQKSGAISVAKGFTKARAKRYEDVIRLDWGVVPGHVMSVIHYVAFDRFVRQSRAVMTNPEFARTVRHRVGSEVYDGMVDPDAGWLAAVSTATADAVPRSLRGWSHLLGVGKQALMMSSIAWSMPTALGDLAGPFEAAFSKHGPPLIDAIKSTAKAYTGLGWSSMRERAMRLGYEPRHRAENIRRKVRTQMEQVGEHGRRNAAHRVQAALEESAWWFMDRTDKLATTVIWDASFEHALGRGATEAEAVADADNAVQSTMPVQDEARKPAFLRDKRGLGQLAVFFGYFSKRYNMAAGNLDPAVVEWENADGATEKGRAALSVAKAAGTTLAMLAFGQLVSELMSGRGAEADEPLPEWVIRKMLAAPFMLFPFVGGTAEGAANAAVPMMFGRDPATRPFNVKSAPAFAAAERAGKALVKALDEERDRDQRFWDVIEVLGIGASLAGLPTPIGSSQVSRTGRYLTGGEDRSPAGVVGGVIYGERANQKANPISSVSGDD